MLTARPIAIPPAAAARNFQLASSSEKLPPTTAATATRKHTSAVASLNSPSASIALTKNLGNSRRRMI